MRRILLPGLVLLAAGGCAPERSCTLESTVDWYVPACEALLVSYPDESRLIVDTILVAYLPAQVRPDTVYGGTSGNSATVLLDQSLAHSRTTTVTFGQSLSIVRINAVFDEGEVSGPIAPIVQQGE